MVENQLEMPDLETDLHTSVDRYSGEPIFSSTLPYTSSAPAKDSVELSSPAIVKPDVLLLIINYYY